MSRRGAFGVAATLLLGAMTAFSPRSARAQDTLSISVTPGDEWVHAWTWKGVRLTARPQMAFWLADEHGAFVATLFVTRRTGKQSWRGGAFTGETREEMRRPSALPVWGHARGIQADDGVYLPTRDDPLPEAETGATPRGGFSKHLPLPADLAPGTYYVYAEINQSLDWNETYREDLPEDDPHYSGGEYGSGQPSLVWRTTIEVGGAGSHQHLEMVGTGHPSGATGEILDDRSKLTTALHVVDAVIAVYGAGTGGDG